MNVFFLSLGVLAIYSLIWNVPIFLYSYSYIHTCFVKTGQITLPEFVMNNTDGV